MFADGPSIGMAHRLYMTFSTLYAHFQNLETRKKSYFAFLTLLGTFLCTLTDGEKKSRITA